MGTLSSRHWSDLLTAVRTDHPELFRPWFSDLQPAEMQHGVISVRTGNPDHHSYLTHNCQGIFSQAAQKVTGRLVTVAFTPPAQQLQVEIPLTFETETENIVLNKDYTFENFVIGPSNRLAHAACVAVAQSPGHVYNPLFVHGSVGLGKTHLLQAVCHGIKANAPDAKILYISCETFTNHFIEAIERGALHQFRYRYRHVDALLIDDIQFLAERDRTREEFFHTFNTLFQLQKQIILSADEAPAGIPSLEDRLVSRFNWGLVARIDAPGIETRMAILRKKAKLRCVDLPEDVITFVATHAASNIRELEGALTHLVAMSQQFGGIIDMELARKALGDRITTPVRPLTITHILDAVSKHYDVRIADLQGKRRNRSIALPRQICMSLARELTKLSLEEIGGHFGGRDHSTVLHAIHNVQKLRQENPDLQTTIEELTTELRRSAL